MQSAVDAAEKIERYTEDMADLEAFVSDEVIVDAVIRNVQIIGEAARHIPNEARARYGDVDWVGMQGMRNIQVHDYAAVRLDLVWDVVRARTPDLVQRLRIIIRIEVGDQPERSSLEPPDDAF